jgi:hypothetical protein
LPTEWVILNFDTSILEEATRRARMVAKGTKKHEEKFVTLPVGDSRDDDPPRGIRNNKGLNYFYQGKTDVCVLGGLSNAVFWMIGLDPAKDLLHNYSPTMDSFWFHFVQHVNGVMHEYGYLLRKLKCQDVLQMDDALPVVVQLRGGDKSESHSVCIYDGSIYDLASQFVLVKSRETLNWCCGDFGFEAPVSLYRLQLNLKVKGGSKRRSRRSVPGWADMLIYILLLCITTNLYMLLYAIALDVHKASSVCSTARHPGQISNPCPIDSNEDILLCLEEAT